MARHIFIPDRQQRELHAGILAFAQYPAEPFRLVFLHGDHRLVRRVRLKRRAQRIIRAQMRHAAERRRAHAADDRPAGVASLLHAAQTFARRCAVADDDKAAQPISGAVLPAEQTVRNKAARAGERDEQQIAEKDHPA